MQTRQEILLLLSKIRKFYLSNLQQDLGTRSNLFFFIYFNFFIYFSKQLDRIFLIKKNNIISNSWYLSLSSVLVKLDLFFFYYNLCFHLSYIRFSFTGDLTLNSLLNFMFVPFICFFHIFSDQIRRHSSTVWA